MKNVIVVCGVVLAALAVGCGGSKEEKKEDAKPATEQQAQAAPAPAAAAPAVTMVSAPAQADLIAHCLKMREQLALCKEPAIDMLMDERSKVQADLATKWADAAKKTEDRTLGLKELEADGQGPVEERTKKCTEVASKVPAQIPETMMALWNDTKGCVDKPCGDRVKCYRPFVAETMKTMK